MNEKNKKKIKIRGITDEVVELGRQFCHICYTTSSIFISDRITSKAGRSPCATRRATGDNALLMYFLALSW